MICCRKEANFSDVSAFPSIPIDYLEIKKGRAFALPFAHVSWEIGIPGNHWAALSIYTSGLPEVRPTCYC
jgi:hypothetical protein